MTKRQAIVLAAGSFIHPIKKSILEQLQSQLSVINITYFLQSQGYRLEQPVVSSYLSDLRQIGLVSFKRNGKFIYYETNKGKSQLLSTFQSRYEALIHAQQPALRHPNMHSDVMQGKNLPLYAAAMLIMDNSKTKKILELYKKWDEICPSIICDELRDERFNSVISNKLRDMRKANLIYISRACGRFIWYALNKPVIELLTQFESEF